MRRVVLMIVMAVVLSSGAMAQDILVKRSGEQLNVKVLSVTKRKVKYVRQGTDAPIYTLPVSQIDYIQYPMGDRDTFGKSGVTTTQKVAVKVPQIQPAQTAEKAEPAKWHGPVAPPKGVERVESIESAKEQVYAIGDIYSENGVTGIVVLLSDGGRHGTIMSIDEACLAWSNEKGKEMGATGATSGTDGRFNMLAVGRYIAEKGLSWDMFPAFQWCRAKGEGWYLPSLNEIWSAGTMYLGGSRIVANRRLRKAFNESLESVGGKPLHNMMYYYSSTESSDRRDAHYTHMNTESPHTGVEFKGEKLFVRAFYKF